jgi:hypothetical protein
MDYGFTEALGIRAGVVKPKFDLYPYQIPSNEI